MAHRPPRRPLLRVRRTVDAMGARVTHVQVRLPLLHCHIRSWRSADGRVGDVRFEPPLRCSPQVTPPGRARRVSWIYAGLILAFVATGFFRLVQGDMVALVMLAVLALLVVGGAALDLGWRWRVHRPR